MLSKIFVRIIPVLLILVSVAFAAAPGWVAKGVVLDYSMNGDTVTFTVTERTSTEVKMNIETVKEYTATENASLTNGQFWFDDSLLADASSGDEIDEFRVTDEGTETFAGKQWDTVTLTGTISGAETVRIYDRDSGLMLKQTVQVPDAPEITLTNYVVPNFDMPPPPGSQPTTQPTGPASEPAQPEPEEEMQPEVTTTDTPPTDTSGEPEPAEPPTETCCLPGAVLLMLTGFVLVRK